MAEPHQTGPAIPPAADLPTTPPLLQWSLAAPEVLPAKLGRYELREVLGKGGMGAVYYAHDTQLHRFVAIKIPHLISGENESMRERFLREARLAATLSHPNLCPVFDYGEIGGVLYLAMAFLEGKPLSRFLRTGQALPPRAVIAVVRQLALAMAEAHAKGIIHRDLKPANIMITPHKQPVIMDFGLARRTTGDDTKITVSGVFLGTPAYMPPEQIDGDSKLIGPSCDIYALGIVLYELLAGRTPFSGPLSALVAQISIDPPPPLRRFRADLDPALDGLCGRALAKKPRDRYPSMTAFASALEAYLRAPAPEPAHDVAPAPVPEPDYADEPLNEKNAATLFNEMANQQARLGGHLRHTQPSPVRRRKRRHRHPSNWRMPLIGATALTVVCGLFLVILVLNRDRRGTPPPDSGMPPDGVPIVGAATPTAPSRPAEARPVKITPIRTVRPLPSREQLQDALETLQKDPKNASARSVVDDFLSRTNLKRLSLPPELSLIFGKYLLRENTDWLEGLEFVMRGTDPRWKRVAELEKAALNRTNNTSAQYTAQGDVWWDLADSTSNEPDRYIYHRARFWYLLAVRDSNNPNLSRIKQRILIVDQYTGD